MSSLFRPSLAGTPAGPRINVTEAYSVNEWATRLGCTPSRLREAVTAVGNVVADVEQYLHPPRDDNPHRAALIAAFEVASISDLTCPGEYEA